MAFQNRASGSLARWRRRWRKRNGGEAQWKTLMKKKGLVEGSRRLRRNSGVERRVRTLKRLVPNGQLMGLDGLFAQTATYIVRLQISVELMKTLIKSLSTCD